MKRLSTSLILLCLALLALPARAHLEGILPLAADDRAALEQVRATSAKHVMLYFGDQAN